MFARTLIVAGGLVLALVGAAAAQTVVTGTVTRIDQPASVILLQDGRMIRVPGGTVLINGQPMAISTIQPGTLVAIQNGQAVTYQNGVYVPADPRRVPYEVSGRVTLIDSVDNVLVLDGPAAHRIDAGHAGVPGRPPGRGRQRPPRRVRDDRVGQPDALQWSESRTRRRRDVGTGRDGDNGAVHDRRDPGAERARLLHRDGLP